jgi:tRNA(adenine34) deaminase
MNAAGPMGADRGAVAAAPVTSDDAAMALALAQADLARRAGEVPVGAVVLRDGVVVGVGRNAPIGAHDPTAHAEIVALRAAAATLGNYRLDGCELFVTLEPCAMCSGAMLHARLARVVYGAADPKTGAAGSVLDLFSMASLNHQTRLRGGVQAEACAALLRGFFHERRLDSRSPHPLRDDALRTPDARFEGLPGDLGIGHYLSDLPGLAGLRLHYADLGSKGQPGQASLLCLHGLQTWSHVFHAMVPIWVAAGLRVVVPDLPGFGRSDKPKKSAVHQLGWHQQVLQQFMLRLGLRDVALVLQGGGGLLALPLAGREGVRAVVAVDATLSRAAARCAGMPAATSGWLPAGMAEVLDVLDERFTGEEDAARAAPFPDRGHRAGPLALATLSSADVAVPSGPGPCPTAWRLAAPTDAPGLARHILTLLG